MSGTESFINALSTAANAAVKAESAAGRAMAAAEAGMKSAREAASLARKEAARRRRKFEWTGRIPAGGVLAKLIWRLSPSTSPAEKERAAVTAEREASRLLSVWKKARLRKVVAGNLATRVQAAERGIASLGELPWDLAPAAAKASGALVASIGKNKGFRQASESLCHIAETWTRRPAIRRDRAIRVKPGGMKATETIWLPIPKSAGPFAKAVGATAAKGQGRASAWHVPAGTDMAPLERFLPLAFRPKPPLLTFPPVPYAAAGQNLWGVFDRGTWDQIRTLNYERTGYRCMLCGGRGGKLSKAIGGTNSGVECHEVWEWKIPDRDVSIGVQELKGILVCCPDCHLVFHEAHARSRARNVGMEDAARRHLMQRRAFLTRSHPVDVAAGMRDEADRLREMSGTSLWIMDLTRLGGQDYMSHLAPVLAEGNPAKVRPGQVAGLAFTTDGGVSYPAVSARRIFSSLSSLYRHDPRIPTPAA